jgi:hypothetical protein
LLYDFLLANDLKLIVGIHYVGKDIADYQFIEKKMKQALEKLTELYRHESN